jgi:hypothetical protein
LLIKFYILHADASNISSGPRSLFLGALPRNYARSVWQGKGPCIIWRRIGFALKDERKPDWAEAEAELTEAIERRGPGQELVSRHYEFVRAICRIEQEGRCRNGEPSDPQTVKAILDDLNMASRAERIRALILAEPTVTRWMTINKIDEKKVLSAFG